MTHKKKKLFYNILAVITVGAGIVYVAAKFVHLGNVEYTDNAQVKQLIVPVNSRISGFVKEIRFDEYQEVRKGDTLLLVEDTEFKFRLAQVGADYENALAAIRVANSSVNTAQNTIIDSDAAHAKVKALLDHNEKEQRRYTN